MAVYLKTGLLSAITFVIDIVLFLYSIWQIDISFGALSINGCVTQGINCIEPMVYYHQYLSLLMVSVFLFIVSAYFNAQLERGVKND